MALQGFHTSEPGKSFRFNETFCLQAESAQSFNNGNMKAAPQLGSNWFPSEPVRSQLEQQTHKDVQKSPELDGAFRPVCCFLVGFSPDQPVSPQLLLLHAAPGSFLPCCGAPAGPSRPQRAPAGHSTQFHVGNGFSSGGNVNKSN